MHRKFGLIITVLVVVGIAPRVRADGLYGPDNAPSLFSYAYRGLFTGAFTGLAGGYLVARHGGLHHDDWRPLTLGAGIGALSGAGLGLALGIVDLADDTPGQGAIALRDTSYGAMFGAIAGAVGGALFMVKTNDGESVAYGAAIGTLAGAGLGLVLGLVEGATHCRQPATPIRATTQVLQRQRGLHP